MFIMLNRNFTHKAILTVLFILLLISGCFQNDSRPTQFSNDVSYTPSLLITFTPKTSIYPTNPLLSNLTSFPTEKATTKEPDLSRSTITPQTLSTSTPTIITSTSTITEVVPSVLGWLVFNSYVRGIGVMSADGYLWRDIDISNGKDPSWSPDGHWLTFAYGFEQESTSSQIGIIRPDGSGFRAVTSGSYFKFDPAWSPDGEMIAYIAMPDSEQGDVFITRVDGSSTWQLTHTATKEVSPTWSPDGKSIAFLSEKYGKIFQIAIMDINGENQLQLTDFPGGFGDLNWSPGGLDWSPDGKYIATFSTWNKRDIPCGQIFTISLTDYKPKQITDFQECAQKPTWSPDGKWIAFIGIKNVSVDFRLEQRQIYFYNVDEGNIILSNPIAIEKDEQFAPFEIDWSPVPAFQVGGSYQVTTAGNNLNLRESPSRQSQTLVKLKEGDVVTVLDGPIDIENYYWWHVRTTEGQEGWVVEVTGWYQLTNRDSLKP